jgi:RNA polymerase sigma factor for flagellar operon FliA
MNYPDERKLQGRRSAELRRYTPLVKKIAGKMRRRLPPNVEMDDLVQVGLMGLDDALRRFEQGPGSTFETYAARRIEGAMLDALRADDTLSRGTRSRLRKVRGAVQRLEHALGRAPRAKEVANELNWSLEQFHGCMVEAGAGGTRTGDKILDSVDGASAATPVNPGATYDGSEHADPLHALQQRQRHAVLSAAFDALDAADRYVMELIYDRDLTLRDVGSKLGISESRVSQMRTTIIAKLKRRLQDT